MNNIKTFFKKIVNSRNLKYGTNSLILTAVVIAIAVIINLLVGMTSLKVDLTSNKLFSIGDQTKEILEKLDKEVVIYGLFDDEKIKGTEYNDVTELLNQYAKYPKVEIKYIDPERNPGIINDLDPENLKEISNNDFVVKSGNKIKKLSYYDLFSTQFNQQTYGYDTTGLNAEQGFTGAIKYVISEVTPVVYFMEGHDENKVDSVYTSVKEYLEMNNYDIKTLNLFTLESVPEDAELIVIASPKKDLTSEENFRLKKYLDAGGKAIFMFDSLEHDTDLSQFENVLVDYGVGINYDKVLENDTARRDPTNPYAILLDIQSNAVIPQKFNTIFANSRSINILKNTKEYISVTSLAKTSDKAVGEQINKARGENILGPLDLAVAVEDKGSYEVSKILVFGNSGFISDSFLQQYGPNGLYFFLYSLNWMQDKEEEVFIEAKMYETPMLNINAQQSIILGIIVVVVVPLIILGLGLFVYLRRRHL